MEIRIKTAEEFHSGNVTIEINGDAVKVDGASSETGYDANAALEKMTENYVRSREEEMTSKAVRAELESDLAEKDLRIRSQGHQIVKLEGALKLAQDSRDFQARQVEALRGELRLARESRDLNRARADHLRIELNKSIEKVRLFDADRKTERMRANELDGWLTDAKASLNRARKQAENRREAANRVQEELEARKDQALALRRTLTQIEALVRRPELDDILSPVALRLIEEIRTAIETHAGGEATSGA